MKMQRTLAPTAAPISLWNLGRAVAGIAGGSRYRQKLTQELKTAFSADGAFLVSSGKAALTVILKALAAQSRRRQVVIPAYTCFSVPSAIVKAGLDVVLCDVNPETLDFNFGELETLLDEKDVLCVVPTHLFGFAADVARVTRLCKGKGIVVVEDAAQAMGAQSSAGTVGSLGDIAFFSLGRGKNLTSGTGGIILTRSHSATAAVEREWLALPEPPVGETVRNWIELVLMRGLIHPALYWLPSGLPFLGLGETKFYRDFPMFRMDEVRALQLRHWSRDLAEANRKRADCGKRLIEQLDLSSRGAKPLVNPGGVYLRLPLLMPDRKAKDAVVAGSRALGAGVSPNYPATIRDIPELAGRIGARTYSGAQQVVDRLVTVPTHRFVQERDVLKLDRILRESLVPCAQRSGSAGLAEEVRADPCSASIR